MTKNSKTYAAAVSALTALEKQLAAEAKLDPRFKRAHGRTVNLLKLAQGALEKYEILHARKVPAKILARQGGGKRAAKVKAPRRAKVEKADNVVQLHPKRAAAARAKSHVKRSK